MPDGHVRAAPGELVAGRALSRETLTLVLRAIMAGDAHPGQPGALLMGPATQGETSQAATAAPLPARAAVRPAPAAARGRRAGDLLRPEARRGDRYPAGKPHYRTGGKSGGRPWRSNHRPAVGGAA